jgi:hypothetical protein
VKVEEKSSNHEMQSSRRISNLKFQICDLRFFWSLLVVLWSLPAFGQVDLERFERQLEQIRRDTRTMVNPDIPPEQRTYFDYGMFITSQYLSFDDSDLENHVLWQYDITAYTRFNIDGAHEFLARGRGSYRDFHKGDELEDDDNRYWDARIERLYYQFDLARYLAGTTGQSADGNLRLKLGRDLVVWANGLTLSYEIDGAMIDVGYGPFTLELLAGRTPSDQVDIDSSRPNFDGNTNRAFYGAMLSGRVGTHRPFVYALCQRDHNSDDTLNTEVGDVPVTTEFDYNTYYLGLGSSGALTDRLAYGIEFVFEGGGNLSNSFTVDNLGLVTATPQERDKVHAWALDVQLDYLLPDPNHTRFSGELVIASGDDDRLATSSTHGGNLAGTDDEAFSSFGLINTGLAFVPAVSNIIVVRGGASTFPLPNIDPFKRLQVGTDLFLFAKLDSDAPIDEETTEDGYLGFEPDLYVNWQLTSDVTLAFRYGAFVPGDAIVNDGKIRQFFYAGMTFAF